MLKYNVDITMRLSSAKLHASTHLKLDISSVCGALVPSKALIFQGAKGAKQCFLLLQIVVGAKQENQYHLFSSL